MAASAFHHGTITRTEITCDLELLGENAKTFRSCVKYF